MPRKPKPPPAWDMQIEGLSQPWVQPIERDDFTGEPIKADPFVMPKASKPPPTPNEYARAKAQSRQSAADLVLLLSKFRQPAQPQLVAPTKPGYRSIALDTIAIQVKLPPCRRF